ncbi:MAG: BMP family ABC transporter substrate-binding protein [Oscillospiraceae bacterium]|nr:BMP family ABC transporter substrate-binding protein [Oscillospiraceae bacterium]
MKKILALVLAAIFLTAMVAACADGNGAGSDASDDIKVALVAHGPESIQFDGSFNEGSWNGILSFLRDQGLDPAEHANFFQAHAADNDARVDVMTDAISWGADILILPGFHFAASVHTAAGLFPDTKFVVLDTRPDPGPTAANTVSILYAEQQSGFLAGYAVVMDGFRDLGFMGGVAVPAVVRFGHGFIEGAEFAANELGLAAGEVTINYHYIGGFAPDPGVTTMAGSWYAGGTEVIFAAAGGAGFSVITAAEDANTWVVGVDVDQSGASPRVITSAMKALAVSVNDMLTEFVGGTFRGGSDLVYDAAVNGVALPMSSSRFSNFTEAQYNAIYAQLANGSIVVSTTLPPEGGSTNPNDLITITDVTVNFIS